MTTLVGMLSLAVFLCLSNGLKLWERTQQADLAEDVALFFDKFSGDLRNAFTFSTLAIDGTEYSFAFPTVVWTRADRSGARAREEFVDQLGRVRYAFDAAAGALTREQANYSQGTRKLWGEDTRRVLVQGVAEVRFEYYYSGAKDPTLSAESKDGLPSGVEIEVRYRDRQEDRTLKRFFPVPLGI